MKKYIKVLDTDYEFIQNEAIDSDGTCNFYQKEIQIRPMSVMLEDNPNISAKERRYKEVLRHELIHAFLFECGLETISYNETVVDFFAIQYPKIKELFERVNVDG